MFYYKTAYSSIKNDCPIMPLPLLLITVATSVVLYYYTYRECFRNIPTIIFYSIASFGIFSGITYYPIYSTTVIQLLCTSSIITLLYTITTRIVIQDKLLIFDFSDMLSLFNVAIQLFSYGLFFLATAAIILSITLDGFSIKSHKYYVKTNSNETVSSQTTQNNMETLLLLQDEEWIKLNDGEKLQVMQTVTNIECNFLKISDNIIVEARDLEPAINSFYDYKNNKIILDTKHLSVAAPTFVLKSVCHEIRHAWQNKLIDLYDMSDGKLYHSLLSDYDIVQFKEDFSDNNPTSNDDIISYSQYSEHEAENYAENAVKDYKYRICSYMVNHNYDFEL